MEPIITITSYKRNKISTTGQGHAKYKKILLKINISVSQRIGIKFLGMFTSIKNYKKKFMDKVYRIYSLEFKSSILSLKFLQIW